MHLVASHVPPLPAVPSASGGESTGTAAPNLIERERAYAAERSASPRAAFAAACRRGGLPSREWRPEEGDAGDVVTRRALR